MNIEKNKCGDIELNSDCYVYFNCLLESNLQKDSSIRRSIRKTTFCRTV